MANRESALIEITPEVLLKAYACGIFPMAESADDPALFWIEPEKRGVIPLDRFHMPARLARTVRSDRFTVTVDRDFGIAQAVAVAGERILAVGANEAMAAHTAPATRVLDLKGVPSIAETAALAAAGRNARLLAARVSNREASCAIAIGEGQ